ncbi:hypothetical protein E2C01_030649 [Portunus trituberculatus]|uniref:Uncharacterized protein n=1 Tax=Portunus trituberculatus TaxID=210409 RepID=A0A5B7EUS6_PORTR|nr:hypothetical protein [Portunus trituberculatus]
MQLREKSTTDRGRRCRVSQTRDAEARQHVILLDGNERYRDHTLFADNPPRTSAKEDFESQSSASQQV